MRTLRGCKHKAAKAKKKSICLMSNLTYLISPIIKSHLSILIYLLYLPYPMMPLMLSHGAIDLDDLPGDIGGEVGG